MAHMGQSRPDHGLGFQVKVLKTFQVVPSSLGSKTAVRLHGPDRSRISLSLTLSLTHSLFLSLSESLSLSLSLSPSLPLSLSPSLPLSLSPSLSLSHPLSLSLFLSRVR